MQEHDPLKFVSGLSAKLATRSRHVCAFLGAGISRACGLPDITQLQTRVIEALCPNDRCTLNTQLKHGNLEQALSRIRRIAALITDDQMLDGLSAERAAILDANVCQAIVKELNIAGANLLPMLHLAAWISRAEYRLPVELFTVNYDLLLETALEEKRVPYFDGFVGSLRAKFHTELVEGAFMTADESLPSFFVRLWKLHGSVNWEWQNDRQIVRLGQPVPQGLAAAIYPSDMKYDESRRVPFVVLQDRLRRSLHQPETLLIVTGYSFGDAHLNELLFDAAARRERSEYVVFCFSEIPDILSHRATITPNIQVVSGQEAILGGVRAKWQTVEDAPPNLWPDGQFGLRDFANLAAYLARSTTREPENDTVIRKIVESVVINSETSKSEKSHV